MTTAPAAPPFPVHCAACGAGAAPGAVRCEWCRARLAAVACPACLALSGVEARHCAGCGAQLARSAGERGDDAPPFACPGCGDAMRAVRVGALDVEECPRCGGLWLAAAAVERLVASQEAQAAVLHHTPAAPAGTSVAAPVRYRPCPSCGALMHRQNFARSSGVVLDVCRAHGTFFDATELHAMVAFVRGGGLERARERQREQLAEEERRLRAREMGRSVRGLDVPLAAGVEEREPLRVGFADVLQLLQVLDLFV